MSSKYLWAVAAILCVACGPDRSGSAPAPPTAPTSPAPVPPPAPPSIRVVFSGTVLDPDGRPVADASVTGHVGKTGGFSTRTNAAGEFRVDPAPTGFLLGVRKPGFQEISRTMSLREDTVVELTLVPGVNVGGLVTEAGVGPLNGATVEILTGPNAGQKTTTGIAIDGRYVFGQLVPGDFRMRVSKPAYDTVETSVSALVDTTQDFTLRWAHGTCLQSVNPVSIGPMPSAGATASADVVAERERRWRATADSPWIEVLLPDEQSGAGRVTFRIARNPPGETQARRGAVQIRCSPTEGQNVWVTQHPDCQVRLERAPDSPAVFPAPGGLLHLHVRTGTRGCRWEGRSGVPWMRTVGIRSWSGDNDIHFVVEPNPTGRARTGQVIVGETSFEVAQE